MPSSEQEGKEGKTVNALAWKILGGLLDVFVVILIGLSGWTGKQLFDIQSRLSVLNANQGSTVHALQEMQIVQKDLIVEMTKIKEWKAETASNRFTVQDGKQVWMEISAIREQMAKMALADPPNWFIVRVDKLEARVDSLEHRLSGRIGSIEDAILMNHKGTK